MRDRKLLDQTLPLKEAGTLVSPSWPFSRSCGGKVKKIVRLTVDDGSVVMGLFQSVPSRQVFGGRPPQWTVRAFASEKKAATRVPREAYFVSRKQGKGLCPALHEIRATLMTYPSGV
jgi:hypothetical protein